MIFLKLLGEPSRETTLRVGYRNGPSFERYSAMGIHGIFGLLREERERDIYLFIASAARVRAYGG